MSHSAGLFIENTRAGGFVEAERKLTDGLSLYSNGWGGYDFKVGEPIVGAEGGIRWEF